MIKCDQHMLVKSPLFVTALGDGDGESYPICPTVRRELFGAI